MQRDRGLRGLSSVSFPSSRPFQGLGRGSSLTHPLSPSPREGMRCLPIRPQSSASVLQHSWPLTPVEYLLDARECGQVCMACGSLEKWSTPCKGGVVLATQQKQQEEEGGEERCRKEVPIGEEET